MENKIVQKHMGMKAKNRIVNFFIYSILIIMCLVWILPFVGILLESFRIEETGQVGYIIPKQWGFDNYKRLFDIAQYNSNFNYLRWYGNTTIIALFSSVIQTIITLCMSYTLSRLRFKGRKILMNFMLILGMFPGFLSLILLYKVLSWLGLTGTNSIWGLILVYTASSGMGYYVSKGYFDTIPRSLDEAARVDGANRAQVLTKIILPLSKPIVIYSVLMGFMGPWGDFMFAKYVAKNDNVGFNVAVGLQNLMSFRLIGDYYTTFCAGGVLVAIPITVIFMFLQKYYVEGVTGGSVKG
jgi:arabinogalactan oligomer/maltooligosaccharide transport system permease protein